MLDGLRVVIGSYLTILCCPSINFFVRSTNSTMSGRCHKVSDCVRKVSDCARKVDGVRKVSDGVGKDVKVFKEIFNLNFLGVPGMLFTL